MGHHSPSRHYKHSKYRTHTFCIVNKLEDRKSMLRAPHTAAPCTISNCIICITPRARPTNERDTERKWWKRYPVFIWIFLLLHSFNEIDEREKVNAERFIRCCLSSICRNRDAKFKRICFSARTKIVDTWLAVRARPFATQVKLTLAANKCRSEQRKKSTAKWGEKRNETIHFWCFSFFLGILSTFLVSKQFFLATFMRSICVHAF